MGAFLRGIFAWVFYPIVVISVFAALVGSIVTFIVEARSSDARLRRGIAAFLPVACLVFLVAATVAERTTIGAMVESTPVWMRFVAGATLGFLLTWAGDVASGSTKEIGVSVYVLILSLFSCVLLFLLMEGLLPGVNSALLGAVLATGLYVMFVGLPFDPDEQPRRRRRNG